MSTRRTFLKASSIATTGFMIVPRHVLGGKGYVAPSDKVNIALIGAGGRGKQNVRDLLRLEDVSVTAIADPAEYWDLNHFYYRTLAGSGPVKEMIESHYQEKGLDHSVALYEDFREMLEKESALDAVLCATPDHTHAYISLMSMWAGKHVYCEKPLTHNIWEARKVKEVAQETGLATQMGNQQHSSDRIRSTVEVLKSGVLGNIQEVHAWVSATRWIAGLKELPTTGQSIPEGLNWDLWLGPRADREFHEYYAPVTWRDFWEFGCGAMGDFGCHDLDAAVWGLDLPAPESVVIHPAGFSNKDITPYGEIGYYQFPATEHNPPIPLTWYAGGLKPNVPEFLPEHISLPSRGALYIGEKGILLYGGSEGVWLFPDTLDIKSVLETPTLSPSNGHHRDWVDAIKGGPAASSNFEYGAHLTEITLLGVLSLRLGGKKIHWNAEEMKVEGIPEAEMLVRESVRAGWEMEG